MPFADSAASMAPLPFMESGGIMLTEDSYSFGIRKATTVLMANAHTAMRKSDWRFSHKNCSAASLSKAGLIGYGLGSYRRRRELDLCDRIKLMDHCVLS